MKIGGVNMYQELKDNENFSDKYATWVIAYCLDTDSFFATNQKHFFWEYNNEFQCENDAINYFRNHLNEFRNARKEILSHCSGWSIDKNDFELVYLKFKWVGNTYYPQKSDKSKGEPIRVYKIKA